MVADIFEVFEPPSTKLLATPLLEMPNLVRMFLIKWYWMLVNKGYNFYRFWVIKEKPTGGKIIPHPLPRLSNSFNDDWW